MFTNGDRPVLVAVINSELKECHGDIPVGDQPALKSRFEPQGGPSGSQVLVSLYLLRSSSWAHLRNESHSRVRPSGYAYT